MSEKLNIRKSFLDPYSYNNGGIFQSRLDEPTRLTFGLDFGAILRAYESSVWRESFNRANYDELPQALFAPASTYDANWQTRSTYSAYAYLLDRNENLRAAMLLEFLKGWDQLQREYQYYFQEISGLDSLLKVDPKSGIRVKEGKIKIKCIEGLDLKVKYLLNLYRKIAWDDVYQRWVLPDIYRYFPMYIYISELRTFHQSNLSGASQSTTSVVSKLGQKLLNSVNSTISQVTGKAASSAEALILSVMDNVVPTIKINCYFCEFVLDSWLQDSYSINNDTAEETTFEITVKDIRVDSFYHLEGFDRVLSDQYDRIISKRTAETMEAAESGLKVLDFEAYANRSSWLADEDKVHSYDPTNQTSQGRTWIGNLINWGKSYVTNIVKDKINELKNKNIVGNLSYQGIVNAIQSKDFVTVFGAVRQAFQKTGGNTVGINGNIVNAEILTDIIKGIASSKATSKEQQDLIDGAKEMLQEPYKIEISSKLSDEEILKRLADYQFKDLYNQSTNNDRSHATSLDGGPDGNLIDNKHNPEKPDIELVPNYNDPNHPDMDLTENKHNPEVPKEDLVPNYNDPEHPDMDLTENKYDGDRSLATELDGGPDGSLTENIHDPEYADMDLTENKHNPGIPDMDLTENKYDGDRSLATELDGGPDGDLTSNYHDPEHADMDLIDNKNPGDRSWATDLDGGPEGTLTENKHYTEHTPMDLTDNKNPGDRSWATDLDGGPEGDLIPNYNDPEHAPMDLTDNKHNPNHENMSLTENKTIAERPLFDLVENKPVVESGEMSLTENKQEITPNIRRIEPVELKTSKQVNHLEKQTAPNNAPNEISLENVMNTLKDSLSLSSATSVDSIQMKQNIQEPNKEEMKLVSNKPGNVKPKEMKLVSNHYTGDRSLATSLDGGPGKIKIKTNNK